MLVADREAEKVRTDAAGSSTAVIDLELIRLPRVNLFTAEAVSPPNGQVELTWDVDGVDRISLDSQSSMLLAKSSIFVPSSGAQGWTLSANPKLARTKGRMGTSYRVGAAV